MMRTLTKRAGAHDDLVSLYFIDYCAEQTYRRTVLGYNIMLTNIQRLQAIRIQYVHGVYYAL